MRVTLDVEQGVWMNLLMRAQQENLTPDEVVTAWLRRATRQPRTVLPTAENYQSKVFQIKGR